MYFRMASITPVSYTHLYQPERCFLLPEIWNDYSKAGETCQLYIVFIFYQNTIYSVTLAVFDLFDKVKQ